MHIEITGRHIEVTSALKEFTEDRLGKLNRLLDDPLDCHVVLFIEKHRHVAEVQLKSKHAVFSGQEETGDLYSSIRQVADKLERQVRKFKEKIADRRRHQKLGEAVAELEPPAPESRSRPSAAGDGDGSVRVVQTVKPAIKPMTAEDALLTLQSSGEPLIVFRDAESGRVSVLHRRDPGHFDLIVPDA